MVFNDNLLYLDKDCVSGQLSFSELVSSLKTVFSEQGVNAERVIFSIGEKWGIDSKLLITLAWRQSNYIGIKLVTFYPHNTERNLPALTGLYLLFDEKNGQPLALLDGGEITAFRTAAVSMLAAKQVVKDIPEKVLVMGAGHLSMYYIKAYQELMKPEKILLWNRNLDKAVDMVNKQGFKNRKIDIAYDLEKAVKQADMISTLTSSSTPLFPGKWCKKGCYIDLVGGNGPNMREADDDLIRRATIYVDTYKEVLRESGDIIIPLKSGTIKRTDIRTELSGLISGRYGDTYNNCDKDLTVFKSVGHPLGDLVAAAIVYEKFNQNTP